MEAGPLDCHTQVQTLVDLLPADHHLGLHHLHPVVVVPAVPTAVVVVVETLLVIHLVKLEGLLEVHHGDYQNDPDLSAESYTP